MRKMAEKAEITSEQIVKIILAGAGIALLIILFISLYNMANVDKDKETAKSYLKSFKDALSTADESGKAEFEIWQAETNANFYLVYFGNYQRIAWNGNDFYTSKKYNSQVCACYLKNKQVVCDEKACENIGNKIVNNGLTSSADGMWVIGYKEKIEITKQGSDYVMKKI